MEQMKQDFTEKRSEASDRQQELEEILNMEKLITAVT